MRRKIASVSRLRDVRAQLRDAAAAELSDANRQLADRGSALEAAEGRRAETAEGVDIRIKLAADVRKLELVRAELAAAGDAVRRAESEKQHAAMHAKRIAAALREKERQLRTSERLLGRLRALRARDAEKREQNLVDDLVASSRWRSR